MKNLNSPKDPAFLHNAPPGRSARGAVRQEEFGSWGETSRNPPWASRGLPRTGGSGLKVLAVRADRRACADTSVSLFVGPEPGEKWVKATTRHLLLTLPAALLVWLLGAAVGYAPRSLAEPLD